MFTLFFIRRYEKAKIRLMGILLRILLLTCFTSPLTQFHAQTPPGFISLDCGLDTPHGIEYPYQSTSVHYSPDDNYVETGEKHTIAGDIAANSIILTTLRSFPGENGRRDCYTFAANKGKQILLRVGFYYGNYDGQKRQPRFDLYVGVNLWNTIIINDDMYYRWETIHRPTSDYLHLCLVNTGYGDPFISFVDLRPMDPSPSIYTRTYGSLDHHTRMDLGSTVENYFPNLIRYNEDIYDRMWRPPLTNSTSIIRTNERLFTQNEYSPPIIVMSTAQQAIATNDSLKVSFGPLGKSYEFYVCLHFAELKPNTSRNMSVFINGDLVYGPFVPSYLTVNTAIHTFNSNTLEFEIRTTADSGGPAFLNAMELYYIMQFPNKETSEGDVGAIGGVKAAYSITKSNWQGDPCLPKTFVWIGVNCSYNGSEPPTIQSLNLSSKGLNGIIAPSIANFTMLQSLDLSFNNLNGEVPDFLAGLPSLKYLSLEGNNFTGPLPRVLKEKSENGSLILKVSLNQSVEASPCVDKSCGKKHNTNALLVIVSSVAAAFAIFGLVIVAIIIRRKRQQAIKRILVKSKGAIEGSSIVPRLRQFTLSEVMSFITDQKVLGRGGFGTVYLGRMDGIDVAVKILHQCAEQETNNFRSEVKILATVYHTNLTRIVGYCDEGTDKAIVLELMENGNLKHHLSEGNPNVLSWERRITIILGAAEGLEYLHHGCKPPIIHRDIKPENILLTKEFEAKLADFGLSRIFSSQSISSIIVGTPGYLEPRYNEQTMLTEKRDVYSFGVVMLVVVTGQSAIRKDSTHITEWVLHKIGTGDIQGIVDPRLEANYDINVAWKVVELAMACVSSDSSKRPSMKYIVKELQQCLPDSVTPHHEPITPPSSTSSLFMPRPR